MVDRHLPIGEVPGVRVARVVRVTRVALAALRGNLLNLFLRTDG